MIPDERSIAAGSLLRSASLAVCAGVDATTTVLKAEHLTGAYFEDEDAVEVLRASLSDREALEAFEAVLEWALRRLGGGFFEVLDGLDDPETPVRATTLRGEPLPTGLAERWREQ